MRFASRKPEYLPKSFYNIKADLPELPPPPLHPATREPLKPEDLEAIFPQGFIRGEGSLSREVPIPDEVLESYSVFRPTPLIYASALRKYLDTPARIFYKYEGVGPVGSHKTNTAIMQAYLAAQEGITALTTETGAGQWGSALAYAGSRFGIGVRVFMVRSSFRQKPGRRVLMEMFGAPSSKARATRRIRKEVLQPGPGPSRAASAWPFPRRSRRRSKKPGVKYSLGSVLDSVLMHQTVIGLEAEKQMAELGASRTRSSAASAAGRTSPASPSRSSAELSRRAARVRFIAVEPDACPSLTGGRRSATTAATASASRPFLYMHSLGKGIRPPPLHAGGLRYHGMAPLVSHLAAENCRAAGGRPENGFRRGHALHADRRDPPGAGVVSRDRGRRSRKRFGPRRKAARRSSCSTSPGTVFSTSAPSTARERRGRRQFVKGLGKAAGLVPHRAGGPSPVKKAGIP